MTMPRPPRPLEPEEKARACDWCSAQPGERCVNPNGVTYPQGPHAARRDGYRAPLRHDPRDEYGVTGCKHCQHPGGLHVIDQWEPRVTHCRVCSRCPGWEDGPVVRWSDRATRGAV